MLRNNKAEETAEPMNVVEHEGDENSDDNENNEDDSAQIVCTACGFEASYVPEGMIPCERCGQAVYCSVHCLQWDWKRSGGHAEVCVDKRQAEEKRREQEERQKILQLEKERLREMRRLEQQESERKQREQELLLQSRNRSCDIEPTSNNGSASAVDDDASHVSMDVAHVFGSSLTGSQVDLTAKAPTSSSSAYQDMSANNDFANISSSKRPSIKERQRLWEEKNRSIAETNQILTGKARLATATVGGSLSSRKLGGSSNNSNSSISKLASLFERNANESDNSLKSRNNNAKSASAAAASSVPVPVTAKVVAASLTTSAPNFPDYSTSELHNDEFDEVEDEMLQNSYGVAVKYPSQTNVPHQHQEHCHQRQQFQHQQELYSNSTQQSYELVLLPPPPPTTTESSMASAPTPVLVEEEDEQTEDYLKGEDDDDEIDDIIEDEYEEMIIEEEEQEGVVLMGDYDSNDVEGDDEYIEEVVESDEDEDDSESMASSSDAGDFEGMQDYDFNQYNEYDNTYQYKNYGNNINDDAFVMDDNEDDVHQDSGSLHAEADGDSSHRTDDTELLAAIPTSMHGQSSHYQQRNYSKEEYNSSISSSSLSHSHQSSSYTSQHTSLRGSSDSGGSYSSKHKNTSELLVQESRLLDVSETDESEDITFYHDVRSLDNSAPSGTSAHANRTITSMFPTQQLIRGKYTEGLSSPAAFLISALETVPDVGSESALQCQSPALSKESATSTKSPVSPTSQLKAFRNVYDQSHHSRGGLLGFRDAYRNTLNNDSQEIETEEIFQQKNQCSMPDVTCVAAVAIPTVSQEQTSLQEQTQLLDTAHSAVVPTPIGLQQNKALTISINKALRDYETLYGSEAAQAAIIQLTRGLTLPSTESSTTLAPSLQQKQRDEPFQERYKQSLSKHKLEQQQQVLQTSAVSISAHRSSPTSANQPLDMQTNEIFSQAMMTSQTEETNSIVLGIEPKTTLKASEGTHVLKTTNQFPAHTSNPLQRTDEPDLNELTKSESSLSFKNQVIVRENHQDAKKTSLKSESARYNSYRAMLTSITTSKKPVPENKKDFETKNDSQNNIQETSVIPNDTSSADNTVADITHDGSSNDQNEAFSKQQYQMYRSKLSTAATPPPKKDTKVFGNCVGDDKNVVKINGNDCLLNEVAVQVNGLDYGQMKEKEILNQVAPNNSSRSPSPRYLTYRTTFLHPGSQLPAKIDSIANNSDENSVAIFKDAVLGDAGTLTVAYRDVIAKNQVTAASTKRTANESSTDSVSMPRYLRYRFDLEETTPQKFNIEPLNHSVTASQMKADKPNIMKHGAAFTGNNHLVIAEFSEGHEAAADVADTAVQETSIVMPLKFDTSLNRPSSQILAASYLKDCRMHALSTDSEQANEHTSLSRVEPEVVDTSICLSTEYQLYADAVQPKYTDYRTYLVRQASPVVTDSMSLTLPVLAFDLKEEDDVKTSHFAAKLLPDKNDVLVEQLPKPEILATKTLPLPSQYVKYRSSFVRQELPSTITFTNEQNDDIALSTGVNSFSESTSNGRCLPASSHDVGSSSIVTPRYSDYYANLARQTPQVTQQLTTERPSAAAICESTGGVAFVRVVRNDDNSDSNNRANNSQTRSDYDAVLAQSPSHYYDYRCNLLRHASPITALDQTTDQMLDEVGHSLHQDECVPKNMQNGSSIAPSVTLSSPLCSSTIRYLDYRDNLHRHASPVPISFLNDLRPSVSPSSEDEKKQESPTSTIQSQSVLLSNELLSSLALSKKDVNSSNEPSQTVSLSSRTSEHTGSIDLDKFHTMSNYQRYRSEKAKVIGTKDKVTNHVDLQNKPVKKMTAEQLTDINDIDVEEINKVRVDLREEKGSGEGSALPLVNENRDLRTEEPKTNVYHLHYPHTIGGILSYANYRWRLLRGILEPEKDRSAINAQSNFANVASADSGGSDEHYYQQYRNQIALRLLYATETQTATTHTKMQVGMTDDEKDEAIEKNLSSYPQKSAGDAALDDDVKQRLSAYLHKKGGAVGGISSAKQADSAPGELATQAKMGQISSLKVDLDKVADAELSDKIVDLEAGHDKYTETCGNSIVMSVDSGAAETDSDRNSSDRKILKLEKIVGRKFFRRRCLLCALFIFVLIAIPLGIGVGVAYRSKSDSSATIASQPPTLLPSPLTSTPTLAVSVTNAPTFALSFQERLYKLLASVSADGGISIKIKGSPQYLAFTWLASTSTLNSLPNSRKIQRYALASLYYSTNGESWSNSDLWLSESDECTWFSRSSTVCDVDGIFINLSLGVNNLGGFLPPELGLLTKLNVLSLSGGTTTSISGALPSELGTLRELQFVSLRQNAVLATLPSSIGSWTALTFLDISQNQFTGEVPTEINLLRQLREADLSDNNFNQFLYLGGLVGVQRVNLANNTFTGPIDASIGANSLLRFLNVENNQFTSIPDGIGLLRNLEVFTAFSNQLKGTLSTDWGGLNNLRVLDLHDNSFSGTLPSEAGLLSNLRYLDLSSNQFTGSIPNQFGALSDLIELFLDSNNLGGTFPVALSNLGRLGSIRVDDNRLTGTVPNEVCAVFSTTLPNFWLDCGGTTPEISCPPGPCCTYCCSQDAAGQSNCSCIYKGTGFDYLC